MLTINDKHYLTSREVQKFMAFLQRISKAYIVIPFLNYEKLLQDFSMTVYNPDTFYILKVGKEYYYNLHTIYLFITSLNLKEYKTPDKIKEHIFSSFMNFINNNHEI